MNLYDGGATAFLVIAAIYFADWAVNKLKEPPPPPPTKCNTKVCDDPESWRLMDCSEIKTVKNCEVE